MQTHLAELIEWIKNEPYTVERTSIITKATELLEKERATIEQAYWAGDNDGTLSMKGEETEYDGGSNYYIKTFTEKND